MPERRAGDFNLPAIYLIGLQTQMTTTQILPDTAGPRHALDATAAGPCRPCPDPANETMATQRMPVSVLSAAELRQIVMQILG